MGSRSFIRVLGTCAIMIVGLAPAHAEHFRLAMSSTDDHYIADILAMALEAEGSEHTHEIIPHVILAQERALRELGDSRARYDVHYSGYDPVRGDELAMVPFPITRGMLGHRLLAVTEDHKDLLANVHTVEDLGSIASIGSGFDWPDTKIMQAAGLRVVTGADVNLWPMLARKRFAAFPRGLNEVMSEIEQEGQGKYGIKLVIDRHIMLVYQYDLFFYLAKSNQHMADILEHGLIKIFESGALDAYLETVPQFKRVFAELKAHPRQAIRLENPLLSESLKAITARFWRTY